MSAYCLLQVRDSNADDDTVFRGVVKVICPIVPGDGGSELVAVGSGVCSGSVWGVMLGVSSRTQRHGVCHCLLTALHTHTHTLSTCTQDAHTHSSVLM